MNRYKQIDKLLDITKENGGVTFDNELNILSYNHGFVVSIKSVIETTNKNKVACELLNLDNNHKIYGLWIDNGVYYLDMNIHELSKSKAIAIGKECKQISIYDIENENCIYLERKNQLVAYHGGGYDGCIWEWNYALFDKNGKFHDLYSSGCCGCDTEEKLSEILDENDTYIYDLANGGFLEFSNKHNQSQVVKMVAVIQDYDIDIDSMEFKCTHCGEIHDAFCTEILTDVSDYWGIGGLFCGDCFYSLTCFNCGGLVSEMEELDSSGCCEYCNDNSDTREVECVKVDDDAELVESNYYHLWNEEIKDGLIKIYNYNNNSIEEYPVECFDIPYEIINPNQLCML